MYLYIYDEFIQDKRFEKDILQIENRLTDLGIAGKVARLALFRDPVEMIRDEIRRGVGTIVAVGGDQTVRKVLDVVSEGHATLGLIPIGAPSALGQMFGIPAGLAACDVISARIVETLDLGMVNGRRFLNGLRVENFQAELVCDGFRITPSAPSELEIVNLGAGTRPAEGFNADPCDGCLEAVLRAPLPAGWNVFRRGRTATSVIPAPSFALRSAEPMSLEADGETLTATRFDISVEACCFRVITGRKRQFGNAS